MIMDIKEREDFNNKLNSFHEFLREWSKKEEVENRDVFDYVMSWLLSSFDSLDFPSEDVEKIFMGMLESYKNSHKEN